MLLLASWIALTMASVQSRRLGRSPRCYTQVAVQSSVPEGRVIVAQQFTAGKIGGQGKIASPEGTVESVFSRLVSNRPYGTSTFFLPSEPSDESLGYCQTPLRGEMFATCV